MLNALAPLLPASNPPLPAPTVIMTNIRERFAGLGRHVGTNSIAQLNILALKGLRLEGTARFQLWAADPGGVDGAISALNSRILAARDTLWSKGFLKLSMRDARPADHIDTVGWRRAADYRVLYEFPFQDTDDAESLLARIPVAINSGLNQSTLVTDHMIRWDNLAAPPLHVRGPFGITSISALTFIPAATPAANVTVTRTFDGAPAPAAHPNMTDFLNAVSGASPAERNAAVTFATIHDFLAALGAAGNLVTMGDWDQDGIPDQYEPRMLTLDPPVFLPTVRDRFDVAYAAPAFDQVAVHYLRLGKKVMNG